METLFWGKRRLGWFVLIENLFVLVSVDVWKCLLLKMGQNPFETFETQTTHANRQISMPIDRFQNKSKSWIFWSLVRGVWDDFGWYKSCFYCPRLMFGWLWDCLSLIKVDLGQLPFDTFATDQPTDHFALTRYNDRIWSVPTARLGHLSPFIMPSFGPK